MSTPLQRAKLAKSIADKHPVGSSAHHSALSAYHTSMSEHHYDWRGDKDTPKSKEHDKSADHHDKVAKTARAKEDVAKHGRSLAGVPVSHGGLTHGKDGQAGKTHAHGGVTHGGDPHIVVEHHGSGRATVHDHPTKKAALAHGTALRKAGKDAYVHSKADAEKHGLDPRHKGGTPAKKAGGKAPSGWDAWNAKHGKGKKK